MKQKTLVRAIAENLPSNSATVNKVNDTCEGCPWRSQSVSDALKNFESLPDSAHVRLPVVVMLLGISKATVWRGVKKGIIPAPKHFSDRAASWNVGALRKIWTTNQQPVQG